MTFEMPPLEPLHLDTDLALSQIGDVEAMNGMLSMLEESLVRDVPQIDKLLADGDVLGANQLLHALKGFIPIFCRAPLCELVTQVEALTKVKDNPEAAPAYRRLMPELNLLIAEVSNYLNG